MQRNFVSASHKAVFLSEFLHLLCVDPSDIIYYTSQSSAHPRLMPFTWLKSRQMSLFTVGLDQPSDLFLLCDPSAAALIIFHSSFFFFLLFGEVYGSTTPTYAPVFNSFLSLHPRVTSPKSSFILQYSNSKPLPHPVCLTSFRLYFLSNGFRFCV